MTFTAPETQGVKARDKWSSVTTPPLACSNFSTDQHSLSDHFHHITINHFPPAQCGYDVCYQLLIEHAAQIFNDGILEIIFKSSSTKTPDAASCFPFKFCSAFNMNFSLRQMLVVPITWLCLVFQSTAETCNQDLLLAGHAFPPLIQATTQDLIRGLEQSLFTSVDLVNVRHCVTISAEQDLSS